MRYRSLLIGLTLWLLPQAAVAASLTFIPPSADMEDLDHHNVYTWRISNITSLLPGGNANSVTGAQLTFKGISNWNNDPNRLFMHLLDTSKTSTASGLAIVAEGYIGKRNGVDLPAVQKVQSGVYKAVDDSSAVPTLLRDDLARNGASPYYTTAGSKLVSSTTANTPIGDYIVTRPYGVEGWAEGNAAGTDSTHSFTTTPENYTYSFSLVLNDLKQYINNGGDIAIGLDPDCHFFNEYIKLDLFYDDGQLPVPEPGTLTLIGFGLAGLYERRRRAKKSGQ